jgi:hypothetical protein
MREAELLITSVILTVVLTFAGYSQENKAMYVPHTNISQSQDS